MYLEGRAPVKCGICRKHLADQKALCDCGQDPHAGWELDGRYRLLGLIAQGGMGMIYRGLNLQNGQLLAIKISRWSEALQHLRQLEPAAARREEEARVSREFQLLQKASSQSPHVVKAYDAMRDDPRVGLYYPMEFLEGLPLAKLPSWGKPLPIEVVVELTLQICDGISVTHGLGVVHRDLNPDNIFIVRTPEHPHYVKLIDFGIARDLYARRDIYNTGHDMAMGHLHYLAPEQVGYNAKTGDYETATAAKLDTRADIFTIGAILFHMLLGYPPFEDDTMEGLAVRDWDVPENLQRARQEGRIPAGLRDIITSCLNPDPDKRPPDIFVLSDMLRSFKEQSENTIPAPFQAPDADSAELWAAIEAGTTPGQEGGLDMFSAEFDSVFIEDDIFDVEVIVEEITPGAVPTESAYMRQDFEVELVGGPPDSAPRNNLAISNIPSDVLDALENAPAFFDDDDEGGSLFESHDDLTPSLFDSHNDLPTVTGTPLELLDESNNSLIDNLIEESLMTSSNPPPPARSGPPVVLLAALFVGVLAIIGGILFFIYL